MIEKHFTLDKDMPGWDHKVSANPEEMKIICEQTKKIYNSLGNGKKELSNEEYDKRNKFRRSLVTSSSLSKGHVLCEDDIVLKRPGTGISPNELNYVIGRKINRDFKADELINWDNLD